MGPPLWSLMLTTIVELHKLRPTAIVSALSPSTKPMARSEPRQVRFKLLPKYSARHREWKWDWRLIPLENFCSSPMREIQGQSVPRVRWRERFRFSPSLEPRLLRWVRPPSRRKETQP